MRKRKGFRPESSELEGRVVLSHGGFRNPSVLVNGFHHGVFAVRAGARQSIVALTNTAFDLFEQDYNQARTTYLAAPPSTPAANADSPDKTAFANYTSYRVDLLAQQILSNVLSNPIANTGKVHSEPTIRILLRSKINGRDPASNAFQPNTLGGQLTKAIPEVNTTASVKALDALAQNQAIESARTAIINGLNIMKNGDFGNHPARR